MAQLQVMTCLHAFPPVPFNDYSDLRRFLTETHYWPPGLQNVLISSAAKYPVRYMIADDSGSMAQSDGNKLEKATNASLKRVQCSRWTELADSLRFHATIAEKMGAPTEFRFLNGSPPIVVGRKDDNGRNYNQLLSVLNQSPGGGTPLCAQIRSVVAQIQEMAPVLRQNAQKAVVVIASDGESGDGDVAAALRPLTNLPVWVVIRLCTDDERVVSYWSNIDKDLELEMDVLDDFFGEANEVNSVNGWMCYGEPLHRLREWGVHLKEMDFLDEQKLSPEMMRSICSVIFNVEQPTDLPHPQSEWNAFYTRICELNTHELRTYDPVTRRHINWIKLRQFRRLYAPKRRCLIL